MSQTDSLHKMPRPSGEVRATTVSPAVDPSEAMPTPGAGDSSASPHGRSHTRVIAEIEFGPTTWTVESHCGVVRIISSRDGCMVVMNDIEAQRAAGELGQALTTAAYSVRRASRGGVR